MELSRTAALLTMRWGTRPWQPGFEVTITGSIKAGLQKGAPLHGFLERLPLEEMPRAIDPGLAIADYKFDGLLPFERAVSVRPREPRSGVAEQL